MDREAEYYGQFRGLHCSEPEDKPSLGGGLDEEASAAEDEEDIAGMFEGIDSDDEEAAPPRRADAGLI